MKTITVPKSIKKKKKKILVPKKKEVRNLNRTEAREQGGTNRYHYDSVFKSHLMSVELFVLLL
jgi:hypothetical protein